jgi:hypothetical protein
MSFFTGFSSLEVERGIEVERPGKAPLEEVH